MFGWMFQINYDAYDTDEPERVAQVLRTALKRDERLNKEEHLAKDDAIKECVFGPNFWLRAHP